MTIEMGSDYQIVDINGVKMQIDVRQAKRVENIKVGDRVRVLTKHYGEYKVSHGVVVGFEPFNELPTIIIAHMTVGYSTAELNFLHFNKNSKDVEVVLSSERAAEFDQRQALEVMDRAIAKKNDELRDLEAKKRYFEENFGHYWEKIHADENLVRGI